jgi:hypothetical protein
MGACKCMPSEANHFLCGMIMSRDYTPANAVHAKPDFLSAKSATEILNDRVTSRWVEAHAHRLFVQYPREFATRA